MCTYIQNPGYVCIQLTVAKRENASIGWRRGNFSCLYDTYHRTEKNHSSTFIYKKELLPSCYMYGILSGYYHIKLIGELIIHLVKLTFFPIYRLRLVIGVEFWM